MINKVTLLGRVGSDVEIRKLQNDKQLASFSLATNESYTDKSGNKIENTEWHNLTVFGGLSKVCESYVKKGDLLYIEGKIQTKKVEEKYYTSIIVSELKMLGGKKEASQQVNKGDDLPF